MKTVILGDPPPAISSLISTRKHLGLDTHDEVWNGEYHMAPAANYRHGWIQARLIEVLTPLAREAGLECSLEFNLGSPDNYRVPDVGMHRGRPSGTWLATAAIVIEVRSPHDESYEKLPFYFVAGADEVGVVEFGEDADTSGEDLSLMVRWFARGANAFSPVESSEILRLRVSDLEEVLRHRP